MRFSSVSIETLAYALPEDIWTSADIEDKLADVYERLKLPAGRLELMTGIQSRRMWSKGTLPSDASALAGKNALQQSQVNKDEIDLLVHCAVCRDRLEPATASYVHRELGLSPRTQILDISNACLGFLNAMVMVSGLIESGQVRNALLVSGENGRPLLETTLAELKSPKLTRKSIKPYFANLTIGCGAVAAVLTSSKNPKADGKPQILGGVVRTDTQANDLCEGDASGDGLAMQTDSEALLEAGVALAKEAWADFKSELDWDEQTPNRVICHQVGKQHQRRLFEALNIDLNKDYSTFEWLGNVGSVSLPITLAHAIEQGAITQNQNIALLGIGSGLSTLMMGLKT